MSTDTQDAFKERMRQVRKEAYQRAKERQEADPRYQAMKEMMKVKRREFAKSLRERRKNQPSHDSPDAEDKRDKELWKTLVLASDLEDSQSMISTAPSSSTDTPSQHSSSINFGDNNDRERTEIRNQKISQTDS